MAWVNVCWPWHRTAALHERQVPPRRWDIPLLLTLSKYYSGNNYGASRSGMTPYCLARFMLTNIRSAGCRMPGAPPDPVAFCFVPLQHRYKAEEYAMCIRVSLKQGFQKCSVYREQPIHEYYSVNASDPVEKRNKYQNAKCIGFRAGNISLHCEQGATMAERLACSPPTKAILVQSPAGSHRIFTRGNRAGRCRWQVFVGDIPFPPLFNSGAAPYSPQSPSSALKTSMSYSNCKRSLMSHADGTDEKNDSRKGAGPRVTRGWPISARGVISKRVTRQAVTYVRPCQSHTPLLDTRSHRFSFRWSLLPLLVFFRSKLSHSFIYQLQLKTPGPEVCLNIYSVTSYHLEGSTHPEMRRENDVNIQEHSSDIGRKQYDQSPQRTLWVSRGAVPRNTAARRVACPHTYRRRKSTLVPCPPRQKRREKGVIAYITRPGIPSRVPPSDRPTPSAATYLNWIPAHWRRGGQKGNPVICHRHNSKQLINRNNIVQTTKDTNRSYDVLQYPIIFWEGGDGCNFNCKQRNQTTGAETENKEAEQRSPATDTISTLTSHQGEPGSIAGRVTGILASGNRVGRCSWLVGFLGDLPLPQPLHSGADPYSLQSPSSALKTSLREISLPSSSLMEFKARSLKFGADYQDDENFVLTMEVLVLWSGSRDTKVKPTMKDKDRASSGKKTADKMRDVSLAGKVTMPSASAGLEKSSCHVRRELPHTLLYAAQGKVSTFEADPERQTPHTYTHTGTELTRTSRSVACYACKIEPRSRRGINPRATTTWARPGFENRAGRLRLLPTWTPLREGVPFSSPRTHVMRGPAAWEVTHLDSPLPQADPPAASALPWAAGGMIHSGDLAGVTGPPPAPCRRSRQL
ncbi:hypothetical protein PR048_031284 [Dryococelus australis]|uniref:Uncharacterized protein n=1 Tax=Dryococelus australis TaxID=614101 RepID=A0ABQ9G5Y4_9NEOP|nr:hypothetical protein PR048_031284 [Dryococelus australis]